MTPTSKRHMLLAALAAAFACGAHAASIQIHKQPNFTGQSVTLNAESQDLKSINFHDQASSLVLDGTWEVCTQPRFNGHCETLAPGRYAKLEQSLNHRIESVRPVPEAKAREARRDDVRRDEVRRDEVRLDDVRRDDSRRDYAREDSEHRHGWTPDERFERVPGWRERNARGAIDIYPGADFNGRPMRVDRDLASLEENSGRASSIVIHEGTWQLCTQAFYEGWCRTFEPGRYASLGRLDNRVASAKLVR